MGSCCWRRRKAVHEEVLEAEDVPEEEMVSMVWHDQGANRMRPMPTAVASRTECPEEAHQNKKPPRHLGNARP